MKKLSPLEKAREKARASLNGDTSAAHDGYAGDHTIDIGTASTVPAAEPGDAFEPPVDRGSAAPPPEGGVPHPPWPSLAEDALHGLAGDLVRFIAPYTEVDPAAILGQTLVAFGSILGRTAHFKAEADVHHLNEYLVLVGSTSKARKGASWGVTKAAIVPADPGWAERCVGGGLSSGEGLINAVGDDEADAAKDKRLLAFEGEFASVLRQTERTGNTLSTILRQAWDGVPLRTLTRLNPLRATGAHISMIGHITRDELVRLLTSTEIGNGFGNRILWLCVRRSQVLPEGAEIDPRDLAPFQQRFRTAAEFGREVGLMRRTEEARALWRAVYPALSEGRPGLAGSLTARAEAHVMRLACLYALLDESCLVDVEHLRAGLAFWNYADQSVRHVWGDSLGDPAADEMLAALRAARDGLTRTQLRDLFQRNQKAEVIGRALALLEECKLIVRGGRPGQGRTAEVWYAC